MFTYVERVDRGVLGLNLVILMLVAFLPVPTGVLGSWLAEDRERFTAVLFYAGTLVVFGLVHNTLWWYVAYRARVTSPHLSARDRRALTIGWLPGPLLYGLAMAIAFIDARYSIALFALIHVLYLLPTARLLSAARRSRHPSATLRPAKRN